MSKDVLNGSRGEDFKKQQEMVVELSQNANDNWEVPTALEAAVSILTHQIRSGESLFSNPPTYTRCLDVFENCQVVVGGFVPSGLSVDSCYDQNDIGVAVLRKFRPLVIG
ncbi:MAG: hypothetical protein H0W50_03050 [Parachlamydiaceae bacterium]|nr:hypothetical protein [Parachlamydiaceae bacterium]